MLLIRIDDNVSFFTCPVIPQPHTDAKQGTILVKTNQYFPVNLPDAGKISISNLSGFIVSEQNLTEGVNQVLAPRLQGYYVMIITDKWGGRTTQGLIVK